MPTATDIALADEKPAAAPAPAPGTPRKVPEIELGAYTFIKNSDGFAWRDFFVRAPLGLILDDLKEPGIWRRVQGTSSTLKKFDRLKIVAYDESWLAECYVAEANANGCTLTKPTVVAFPTRMEVLYEDELYRRVWVGGAWRGQRKKDGQFVTPAVLSARECERDISNLYGRPVGDPR